MTADSALPVGAPGGGDVLADVRRGRIVSRSRRVRLCRTAAALSVLLALAAASVAPAASPQSADLTVTVATKASVDVKPAGVVVLTTVVGNVGGRRAAASHVQYVLARGPRPRTSDASLVVLHRVGALAAGTRTRTAGLRVVVPPSARPGRYTLFACVSLRPPARERRTANNCRSAGPIRVLGGAAAAVAPVRSDDRAVAALVDSEGGSLEATAADGSLVRLVLPAGALTGPLHVRLIPLLRLDGSALPGATFVAGAAIEPAGVLLAEPARLEVTPPAGAPPPVLGLSFDPGGSDAHLVPVLGGTGFSVIVDRFVGFAAVAAVDRARTAAGAPLPAYAGFRVLQVIAVLQAERARGLAGVVYTRRPAGAGPSDAETRLQAAAYYVDVIRPQLVALAGASVLDPDAAIATVRRLTLFLRQLTLIGIDDPLPDAYAGEASALMQEIVRKVFDERIRRCKRGEVRSAVGMIGFLYRGSGSAGAPIGVPPFARSVDETLGADWPQRAAVCLRLRFRVDVSTTNEWRLGGPLPELSLVDVGWHDGTSDITAELLGYSATVGEPASSLIQSWQQGLLLRWYGTGPIAVDNLRSLPRPHPPPEPGTCEVPTDAAALRYRSPQGTLYVEIVPVLESFDERVQRVDETGKLQLRYAEKGLVDKVYVCSVNGAELLVGPYPLFEGIHQQRGEDGMFRQVRGAPATIGRERWYTLPLQGGTQDLTEGGSIVIGPMAPPASTGSTTGLLTVTVIPPSP